MTILPIDPALLDLHGVDEEESEAVALCLIELVLAETNAQYRQHCLAREAVETTAKNLTRSLFDVFFSSQLAPESALSPSVFESEPSPVPEINDRHAARCLPHRSTEKPSIIGDRAANSGSPTQRSRADSNQPDRSRMSVVRRRKPLDKGIAKTNLVTIPQVITMPEVVIVEDPSKEAWRESCLKELNGEGAKKINQTSGSKFPGFTRQSPLVEPRVSNEVEVIDSSTALLRHELSGSKSIKMKSSLNTFCAITTTRARRESTKPSTSAGSKRNSLTPSQSAPTLPTPAARRASAVQLNDSLSRKRSAMSPPSDASLCGSATGAETHPWRFDLATATVDPGVKQGFAPDLMVASAASIPTTIALTAGVGLSFGEEKAKGPELRESSHTMSRKRFELHQRLATEMLLQESLLLQQPPLSSSPTYGAAASPTGSVSPLSTYSHSQHHKNNSPRPYETVPADPIPPMPSLSPIAKDALVIPRNHLSQSASTPALRVRNPSARRRNEAPSLVSTEELDALRRSRPSTAALATLVTTKSATIQKPSTKQSLSTSASAKYLREFPKPHAGTIKLNSTKPLLPGVDPPGSDSARQRMAWIS